MDTGTPGFSGSKIQTRRSGRKKRAGQRAGLNVQRHRWGTSGESRRRGKNTGNRTTKHKNTLNNDTHIMCPG